MKWSEKRLKKYGVVYEDKHEYEICFYSMKNTYSYAQAQQVMKNLKKCKTRNRNKIFLRAYKCKCCNGWHLTSEKPTQYREERRVTYEKRNAC